MTKIISIPMVLTVLLLTGNTLFATEKDTVLAKIGEKEITQGYLESVLESTNPKSVTAMFKEKMESKEWKKQYLNHIIAIKLFSEEATRLKLNENPTIKIKIENMTENILSDEYAMRLRGQIKIEDDEVKDYYEKNRSEFHQPEQIKTRHILVATEEEAKAIQKELNGGKDFAQLAEETFADPEKTRGGDLGWLSRGRMAPEFDQAAFSLKKGEISEIVHTKYGYHLIKVEDRKEVGQKPFDEVKDRIKQKLQRQRGNEKIEAARTRLSKEMKVEILDEDLK